MAVEFFVSKFPHLFQDMDIGILAEQLMSYQVLPDIVIQVSVKTDVGLDPDDPYHVDALWAYLNSRRVPGTNRPEFDQLFKVASAILTPMLVRIEYSSSKARTKHQAEVHSYSKALCHLSLPLKLI